MLLLDLPWSHHTHIVQANGSWYWQQASSESPVGQSSKEEKGRRGLLSAPVSPPALECGGFAETSTLFFTHLPVSGEARSDSDRMEEEGDEEEEEEEEEVADSEEDTGVMFKFLLRCSSQRGGCNADLEGGCCAQQLLSQQQDFKPQKGQLVFIQSSTAS